MPSFEELRFIMDRQAIRDRDIERIKRKLHIGDKIRIPVKKNDFFNDESHFKFEKCFVTGVYDHIVTFRRMCGLSVSYTYPEMINIMKRGA